MITAKKVTTTKKAPAKKPTAKKYLVLIK